MARLLLCVVKTYQPFLCEHASMVLINMVPIQNPHSWRAVQGPNRYRTTPLLYRHRISCNLLDPPRWVDV